MCVYHHRHSLKTIEIKRTGSQRDPSQRGCIGTMALQFQPTLPGPNRRGGHA
jgi:hypothetical protein